MSVTPARWPTVTLEVGFASNPTTAVGSTTWTDVTAYLRAFDTRRGRQHELDRFEAGTARFTLDNKDRRFDPTYTSSPYSPNVLPMRRVRLRATYNAVTYDLFNGFVESWQQQYPTQFKANKGDATVELQCVDGFKVLANSFLSRSVYEIEVRADSPTHWWRFGDKTPNTTAGNEIASASTGTIGEGVELGAEGLLALDDTSSFSFENSVPDPDIGTAKVRMPNGTGPSAPPVTIEGWIILTKPMDGGDLGATIWMQGSEGSRSSVNIYVQNSVGNVGKLNFNVIDGAGNQAYAHSGTTLVNDGLKHHFACTLTGTTPKVYIDGVDVTTGTITSGTVGSLPAGPITVGGEDTNTGNVGFPGRIQDVAVYASAVSAARVLAHYNAGTQPWDGDLTGARLARILDEIDWSSADRTIATGIGSLQATRLDGQSALEYGQLVETTEAGALFINTTGKVVFRDREYPLTNTTATTSNATFGDGGGSELPYHDIVLPYDDTNIRNHVKVSREGGTVQISEDSTSQTTYLKRSYELSGLLHDSDRTSQDRADWIVAHYKDAALRVERIEVTPDRPERATLWPQVLGREIQDRLTIKRRPPNTGTISQDVLIEGIEHRASISSKEWTTTWQLSPAETQQYWIWGTSTWGETTRWSF